MRRHIKGCRREPRARADTLISRRRRSDHDGEGLPASIPRQVLPRLDVQALTIPRTQRSLEGDRGARVVEALRQAVHLRDQRIHDHGHMVTMPQESHPGLVQVRSRNRVHGPEFRPIQVVPHPQSFQALALLTRNRPVGLRTNVEQEVSATRHHIHQLTDVRSSTQALTIPLGTIIPERQACTSK